MPVTARSVFAYNSQQRTGPQSLREYPLLQPATAIEVRLPDGREWQMTFGAAITWANRVAEQQAARWKRSA